MARVLADDVSLIFAGIEESNYKITTNVVRLYTNPCIGCAYFILSLSGGVEYSIKLFDTSGRLINVIQGISLDRSELIKWNLKDKNGTRVSGGVYLYRLETEKVVNTGKIILLE